MNTEHEVEVVAEHEVEVVVGTNRTVDLVSSLSKLSNEPGVVGSAASKALQLLNEAEKSMAYAKLLQKEARSINKRLLKANRLIEGV
jgi:hypothetical protein